MKREGKNLKGYITVPDKDYGHGNQPIYKGQGAKSIAKQLKYYGKGAVYQEIKHK